MKPLLFRFKIAVLSVLLSGALVVGFGVFFLVTIGRVGMARIDDEIRALGETQLRGQHPIDHWTDFDSSLEFIYGEDRSDRVAVLVLNSRGDDLFQSEHWPGELAELAVPALEFRDIMASVEPPPDGPPGRHRPPPIDGVATQAAAGFVERLDADGDNMVSPEEFDGPAEHFAGLDRDSDGHIGLEEAPRRLPVPGWAREDDPNRPPHAGRAPPPLPHARPGRHPHMRLRNPVFETHEFPAGAWRVGFMGNQLVTLVVASDLAEYRRETAFFSKAFLLIAPIALLALAGGGWFLASRAMRPVAVVTRTAEAITARGLDRRVPAMAADAELQRLVDVINRMLDRLERSFHQAARFSADAAHELQTPLTVLQGELDNAVQHAAAGSEEQQRYSGLLEEVRGLKAVVQKLLLLARADVGQLPLSLDEVDLSELVRSAVEDVETVASHLTVETEVPRRIRAKADPDLIRQVIGNMTSNAVKYSREGGTVRFSLKADGNVVSFT
ncbi:histidine kinase dimerization/phospho-acceptor domain-containing protein, partial [Verrucomicrobiota bacterium]